jgi:hypothetical protein
VDTDGGDCDHFKAMNLNFFEKANFTLASTRGPQVYDQDKLFQLHGHLLTLLQTGPYHPTILFNNISHC